MILEKLTELFISVMQQLAMDIIALLPKLILTILILVIATIVIKLLNGILSKILDLVNLDEMIRKLTDIKLPFSLKNLIITLIDIGIILIVFFGLANLFLGPQHMEITKKVFEYGARIISIVVITIFIFVMFTVLIERINIKNRMRGYVIFILLILITMMLIDLTALSESTKNALVNGLSIGLGIAVGIYAFWFFFHDYLDKLVGFREPPRKKQRRKS
jgi:hypothetical protein